MTTPTPRARHGLTLVELLVVVSIIGLLLGLLLPAVQSSRESARRATCQANLRQQGIALQSHEETHQALPSLYNGTFLPQPRWALDEFYFHSWRTAILPRIEQSTVSNQLNLALAATDPANQTSVNVSLSLFLCPSTTTPTPNVPDLYAWHRESFPVWDPARFPPVKVGSAARNDYEVVCGVVVAAQRTTSGDLSGIRFGAWGEPTYDISNGHSLRYRRARLADVTDGLSNTILVGERAGRPDLHEKGKSVDPYPYLNPSNGMDTAQAAWATSTHIWWMVYGETQSINQTNRTGVFSFHPAGANVALADGSVRFLKESTASAILKALATRSGGEAVSFD
ncbi:DUF1559 domain-containing protein [Isosphaeraceae bacterium EP7]